MAAVVGWLGWRQLWGSAPLDPRSLVPLALLAVVGVLVRERGLGPHLGITVGTVVLAAAIPLTGPGGAALVGGLAYLMDVRARTWRTRIFNSTMTAAVGALGGVAYLLLGGRPVAEGHPDAWALVLRIGLPLLAAYVVMTVTNALAVGAMSALVRGTRVWVVASHALRSLGWGYLAHVVIAFLFVVLWGPVDLGVVASLFVVGPLLVAHWTIGRAVSAVREHQETVTSFVAALEHAEPSSLGHSARVASLAESLGSVLGLGGQAGEDLRYAALLHDIGLVGLRAEIAPGAPLDEISYLTALSTHPEASVSALRGLDFLEGALPAIAHHHERYDGHGYPAGLAGEQIPLAARIIAVADAFDALTAHDAGPSLGPSRALERLREGRGTHLDPDVVEALAVVLSRQRAADPAPEATDPRPAGLPVRLGLAHHDLPEVSDAYAGWQPETGRSA